MITLAAALKDMKAFDGVVLMGPLIHIDPALASPMKLWVVRMLSRIAPNLSVTQPLGNWETRHRFQNPIFFLELDWILQIGQLDLAQVSRDSQQQELMKGDDLRWKGGVKSKWATAVYEALTVNIWILFFVFKNISSDDTPAAFPASFSSS